MLFLQHVALNCSVVVSLIKQTKIQQTKANCVKKRLSISLIKSTPIHLSWSERYCLILSLIMTNQDFRKSIRTLQNRQTD